MSLKAPPEGGTLADNGRMSRFLRGLNVPAPMAPAPLRLVPASGRVAIDARGFSGAGEDGLAQALYAYPVAHHPFWRTVRAQARVAPPDAELAPGQFDEHLALDGVDESQLWLGDVLRFPDCVLVVSGPRLPDARFNETLGFRHAAKMVAQSRWCGFWLAVRNPGTLAAGDAFELLPGPRSTGLVELFRARLARAAQAWDPSAG